jgi:hypothetical protein
MSSAPNAAGWHDQPVTVTLNATDATSGVESTLFQVDGGAVQSYKNPFSISSDGTHNVVFWSRDNAGNVEDVQTFSVKLDTSAPKTGIQVSPAADPDGTFPGPVTVTLNASDAGSGVAGIYYRLDGDAPQTYSAPFTVAGSGEHTVEFWSKDHAGNSDLTHSKSIEIASTAVTLSLPGNVTVPATSSAGALVTFSASAADGSGAAHSVTCTPPSGSVFPPGLTTVQCSTTDSRGNTISGSFQVQVYFDWTVLEPTRTDGSASFNRAGRILVKFRLVGASAGITDLVARLYVAPVINGVAGDYQPATSVSSVTDNVFFYEAKWNHYSYLLDRGTLAPGRYRLKVDLGDGVLHTLDATLR